jgi:flagellum-specific peptidoglycan hydrolase FlgJ
MDQMTAAAKAEGMTLDKFLETEQGKAMRDKGEAERQNKLRLQQLGAAQALDSTVKQFGFLNKITATLSETFTNVIKKLGGSVAGGTPSATPFAGNQKEFYEKIYNTLLAEATKAGVANPEAIARLGAAQSSLETGYGKSTAAGNNYFGIKARAGDPNASMVNTQEYDPVSGKMITQKAGFRKYGSMEESAADYIKFLQENPRYKSVLSSNSAADAIAAQGRTGYATDPDYAKKLQSIHASGFNGTTSGPASGFRPNLQPMASELATYGGNSSMAAAAQAEFRADTKSTAQLITKIDELIDVNRAMLGTSQRILRYQQ